MQELYSKDYGYKKVFVYRLNKPLKFTGSEEMQKRFYIKSWKYYNKNFHKMNDLQVKHNLEVLNHFWRKKVRNDLEYFDTILIEQYNEDCVRYSIVYWLEDVKKVIRIGGGYIGSSYYLEDLRHRGY